jgi:serine/threonine-protein kinase
MKADLKLVAQFVIEHGIADAEKVRECVDAVPPGGHGGDLTALLHSRGCISDADLDILHRVFQTAVPSHAATTVPHDPSDRASDERWAKVVMAYGMLTEEFVADARKELARRRAAGGADDLKNVFLDMGFLTAFQITDLQKKIGKVQFRCEGCDKLHLTAVPPEKCLECGLTLPRPGEVIVLEVGASSPRVGTLTVLLGTNPGFEYEIAEGASVTLGRQTRNKVRIYGKNVSRDHAVVINRGGTTLIQDRKSRFGTFVNARRIVETELADGDLLKLGTTVLEYRSVGGASGAKNPLFGRIAVKGGLALPENVVEALEAQEGQGEDRKRIGEILVSKKFLALDEVADILSMQKSAKEPPEIAGYEIMMKIGAGGMGTVYKAQQVSLERVVALKVLAPHLARDSSFIRRFLTEARSAGRLNHANIIRAIDVGESNGRYYFAMEFVDGETVYEFLKREGTMGEEETIKVGVQMLKALCHAEKHGIVHRDIKPDNIMISRMGQAKLCDLGLAKSAHGKAGETQADEAVGTPNYVSPEQAKGVSDIDIRADIYSLGASLYHMATGQIPFRRGGSPMVVMAKHITEQISNPRRLNPSLSRGFCKVMQMMMVKDRDRRYQHPQEIIDDFERVGAGKEPKLPRIITAKSTISKEA